MGLDNNNNTKQYNFTLVYLIQIDKRRFNIFEKSFFFRIIFAG